MLLWSIIGVSLLSLFGFKIDFVVWLVSTAVLQAIIAYALTRNMFILKSLFPAVFTGTITLLVVPLMLDGPEIGTQTLKLVTGFFYWAPLAAFGVSIIVSTFIGVFYPTFGMSPTKLESVNERT